MKNRQRLLMAVTVLSLLTVTGFVIGCDSESVKAIGSLAQQGLGDDGTVPTVPECTQGGNNEIRNICNFAINVGFRCSSGAVGFNSHYRIEPGESMDAFPIGCTQTYHSACGTPRIAVSRSGVVRCDNPDSGVVPPVYEP